MEVKEKEKEANETEEKKTPKSTGLQNSDKKGAASEHSKSVISKQKESFDTFINKTYYNYNQRNISLNNGIFQTLLSKNSKFQEIVTMMDRPYASSTKHRKGKVNTFITDYNQNKDLGIKNLKRFPPRKKTISLRYDLQSPLDLMKFQFELKRKNNNASLNFENYNAGQKQKTIENKFYDIYEEIDKINNNDCGELRKTAQRFEPAKTRISKSLDKFTRKIKEKKESNDLINKCAKTESKNIGSYIQAGKSDKNSFNKRAIEKNSIVRGNYTVYNPRNNFIWNLGTGENLKISKWISKEKSGQNQDFYQKKTDEIKTLFKEDNNSGTSSTKNLLKLKNLAIKKPLFEIYTSQASSVPKKVYSTFSSSNYYLDELDTFERRLQKIEPTVSKYIGKNRKSLSFMIGRNRGNYYI